MEGYKEGLNVGVFIAHHIVKTYLRDVTTKTLDLTRFMTFESFKDLDEGNKRFGR